LRTLTPARGVTISLSLDGESFRRRNFL
jgi:hypothetical protein